MTDQPRSLPFRFSRGTRIAAAFSAGLLLQALGFPAWLSLLVVVLAAVLLVALTFPHEPVAQATAGDTVPPSPAPVTSGVDTGVTLSAEAKRRRDGRSTAIALALIGLVVVFYTATIVRLGPNAMSKGSMAPQTPAAAVPK